MIYIELSVGCTGVDMIYIESTETIGYNNYNSYRIYISYIFISYCSTNTQSTSDI